MTAFSTEERQLLSESAEAWFADRYGPEHSKKLTRDTEDGFGREEWKTYAEMGWLGLAPCRSSSRSPSGGRRCFASPCPRPPAAPTAG